MNETAFETIASAASVLKVDFSAEEFAGFVEDHGLSEDAIEAVRSVFSYLKDKKQPAEGQRCGAHKGTSVTGGDLLSQKSRFHRPCWNRKNASGSGLWLFLLPARNEDLFH